MRVLANLMMGFTIIFMPGVVLVILFWQSPAAPSPRVIPVQEVAAVDGEISAERQPVSLDNIAGRSWRFCAPEDAQLRLHVQFDCAGVLHGERLTWELREGQSGEGDSTRVFNGDRDISEDDYAWWEIDVAARLDEARITLEFDTSWAAEQWSGEVLVSDRTQDEKREVTLNLGVLALGSTELKLDPELRATISLEAVEIESVVEVR